MHYSSDATTVVSRDRLLSDAPIVVHSHLRWDFVWQRPQQLLSRLSRTRAVLFIEEPLYLADVGRPRLHFTRPLDRLYRVIPQLPADMSEAYDEAMYVVRQLVRSLVAPTGQLQGLFESPVQWYYTPMPAPAMLGAFGERGVVYDCMDELSKFRFAPPELALRERLLLARADVVFAGGERLFESKSRYHRNVHFFGCGVDVEHFAKARDPRTPLAAELRGVRRPVLGYFGVIDERLDYDLLRRLAESHPDASLVLVGPLAKVDRRELPTAPNIHWLGQRAHDDLPAYVKGFDVCLMPFALNEATEFINPTKTLEYMAAGKPVVSTAIADVVRHFTPIVQVAHSSAEFVSRVAKILAEPDAGLVEQGIERARGASWDNIVAEMSRLIADAVERRSTARRAARGELTSKPVARGEPARFDEVDDDVAGIAGG